MKTTKITGLTALNVRALRETLEDFDPVTLGKTVAEFDASPEQALAIVAGAISRAEQNYGRKGHPVQSLHAVVRKIERQTAS